MFPLIRWNGIRRVGSHSEYSTDRIRSSRHMNPTTLHLHINFGTSVCHLFFGRAYFVSTVDTISDNSVDGAYTGNIVSCAYSFVQKPVPNLPGKHGWVRTLVLGDLVNNGTCCYLRLTSSDYARPYGASLVESAQNLTDTTVGNPQLPGNVTWPDSALSKLNNSRSNNIGKRSSIDEQPSELVNPSMS